MYHEDHVTDPHVDKRTGHKSGCGVTEDVQEWMRSVQESESSEADHSGDVEEEEVAAEVEKDFNKVVDDRIHSQNPSVYNKYKVGYLYIYTIKLVNPLPQRKIYVIPT